MKGIVSVQQLQIMLWAVFLSLRTVKNCCDKIYIRCLSTVRECERKHLIPRTRNFLMNVYIIHENTTRRFTQRGTVRSFSKNKYLWFFHG